MTTTQASHRKTRIALAIAAEVARLLALPPTPERQPMIENARAGWVQMKVRKWVRGHDAATVESIVAGLVGDHLIEVSGDFVRLTRRGLHLVEQTRVCH